jgi:hypothetical protein
MADIREALERTAREYASAREQPFQEHPLAEFIRTELPAAFAPLTHDYPTFSWQGSAGRGGCLGTRA